jgi:hypothetical protein
MKNIIANLNKAFESRVRLGIMSVLMVNESVDFNSLKELSNSLVVNPILSMKLPKTEKKVLLITLTLWKIY